MAKADGRRKESLERCCRFLLALLAACEGASAEQEAPLYVIREEPALGEAERRPAALEPWQERQGKLWVEVGAEPGAHWPSQMEQRDPWHQPGANKASSGAARRPARPQNRWLEWERPNATERARRRAGGAGPLLVCYVLSWSVYRPGAGRFHVDDIDPHLCTHLVYAYAGLSYDNSIKPLDPKYELDENGGAFARLAALKRRNPALRTMISVGGWNEGSLKYSRMARDASLRARFVQSALGFLARFQLDGLELDWQFPGARGGQPADKANLVSLVRELSEALRPRGYLLSLAASARRQWADAAYQVRALSERLDFISVHTFDYHGAWDGRTGPSAPLFGAGARDAALGWQQLNVNWTLSYWLAAGAHAHKLLLGVGAHGRSFQLAERARSARQSVGAPSSGPGPAGAWTREPGAMGYNEICGLLAGGPRQRQEEPWTLVRDPDYLAPFAVRAREWIAYEDPTSVQLKAQFARSLGLAGLMLWTLDTDDFGAHCQAHSFPLARAARRALEEGRPPAASTPGALEQEEPASSARPARPSPAPAASSARTSARPASSSSATSSSATSSSATSATSARPASSRRPAAGSSSSRRPGGSSTRSPSSQATPQTGSRRPDSPSAPDKCSADGLFGEQSDCRKFYRCVSTPHANHYSIYSFSCGPGTAFNQRISSCDFAYNVAACRAQ